MIVRVVTSWDMAPCREAKSEFSPLGGSLPGDTCEDYSPQLRLSEGTILTHQELMAVLGFQGLVRAGRQVLAAKRIILSQDT